MKTKLSLAISAALLSSASYAATEYTGKQYAPEVVSVQHYTKSTAKINGISAPQRFIVELSSPAVALYQGGIGNLAATALESKTDKINVQSVPVQSYAAHLAKEQTQFASSLSQLVSNAKVERGFKTLFNGVTVVGQGLSVKQLAALPGVKSVYPERMYDAQMDASHEVINSEAMWNAVNGIENAGAGIKVAIIDSGIRPENPMFSGEGFTAPSELPTDDYCSTVDASFCNDKLIVARWSQPTFPVCADEYMSPLGFGGHGTHVAGTAVGNKVTTTYNDIEVDISGVAPAAYLMAYKALYVTEDSDCSRSSGSNIMLMEALEHAVNDGADVINNSWGGGAGGDPANSPYKAMFEAAEAAGVVVVSAAGNDGNGSKTIGCPGCIESGITVANTTHGRFFANSFNAGGEDLLAIQGNNGLLNDLTADINLPLMASVNVSPDNYEGCEAFDADAFKGSIALISRGACTFALKASNAADAGAEAIVIYNNRAGIPITMDMPDATIPAVMIAEEDAETVIASLGDETTPGTIAIDIQRIVNKAFADTVAATSSRGPNGNENILKPDLAAPGTNILSAYSPDEDGLGLDFNAISGTSMASPHVAGAAALLSQLHPDWSATEIKTALTSTAQSAGILDDDAETPATPFDMGAGRMDLDAAAKAILTFDKPSVAGDSCVGVCTFTRTVTNKSDMVTAWTLTAAADAGGISISPTALELAAGASATFTVTVDSTFADYGEWIFGNVMITSSEGNQDAHLPLAVMAKESSDSTLISTVTTDTDINAADEFTVNAVVNNTLFEDTITITASAPEGTQLTSADDVSISIAGATQNGMEINEEVGVITWVGQLDLPEMVASHGNGSYPNIAGLSLGAAHDCTDGCDETSFVMDTPSFKYNGQTYTQLTVSDNGIVVPGNHNTSGTWSNKQLPDNGTPNNIVAPFWSDFDLSDDSGTDSGGGTITTGFVGNATTSWLVVEWNNAQLWNDPSGDQYSFSVWFKLGDDEEVTFNYFDIPNLPADLTIGAENIGGTIGATYHYNGQGGSVAAGDFVDISSTTAGSVNISYKAVSNSFNPGATDMVTVNEDADVSVDVLANDIGEQKVARVSVTGDGMTASAQKLIDVAPAGALTKVTITDEASNGEAVVATDGTITYTPNADFFGSDSFSYSSEDSDGNTSAATKVMVTVNNVNDAPTVAPTGMSSTEGFAVAAQANGSDVDGDELTYTWTQTSGDPVSFANGGSKISFSAPAGDHTLVFSVVASDGELTSEAGSATITVNAAPKSSSGGGSMGWLTALLLPLALLRRRK